jgi:hypothetical protein
VVVTTGHGNCWRSQFFGDKPADKPSLQAHAAPQLRLNLTSPSVAHELALTSADEKDISLCSGEYQK